MSVSADPEPSREWIDQTSGPILLEFGASWCPHCKAVAPLILASLHDLTNVRHIKIEDGPGKPLGRSFFVKLWPTLVFLRDGKVLQRLVRPDPKEIREGFASFLKPD